MIEFEMPAPAPKYALVVAYRNSYIARKKSIVKNENTISFEGYLIEKEEEPFGFYEHLSAFGHSQLLEEKKKLKVTILFLEIIEII